MSDTKRHYETESVCYGCMEGEPRRWVSYCEPGELNSHCVHCRQPLHATGRVSIAEGGMITVLQDGVEIEKRPAKGVVEC